MPPSDPSTPTHTGSLPSRDAPRPPEASGSLISMLSASPSPYIGQVGIEAHPSSPCPCLTRCLRLSLLQENSHDGRKELQELKTSLEASKAEFLRYAIGSALSLLTIGLTYTRFFLM